MTKQWVNYLSQSSWIYSCALWHSGNYQKLVVYQAERFSPPQRGRSYLYYSIERPHIHSLSVQFDRNAVTKRWLITPLLQLILWKSCLCSYRWMFTISPLEWMTKEIITSPLFTALIFWKWLIKGRAGGIFQLCYCPQAQGRAPSIGPFPVSPSWSESLCWYDKLHVCPLHSSQHKLHNNAATLVSIEILCTESIA